MCHFVLKFNHRGSVDRSDKVTAEPGLLNCFIGLLQCYTVVKESTIFLYLEITVKKKPKKNGLSSVLSILG